MKCSVDICNFLKRSLVFPILLFSSFICLDSWGKLSCLSLLFFGTLHSDAYAATAKSFQSCLTLWDPIDGSPPGSPVPGILLARTMEWVAISFSNAWKWKWKWSCSVVSDSSRPHGPQPTRLFRPWDFPGKSTGVGCHCLLRLFSY